MPGDATEKIFEARSAYDRRDWDDAFHLFEEADRISALDLAELERFGHAAALSGHDVVMLSILERLYRGQSECGMYEEAARSAFWAGFRLVSIGEAGQANAWFQRARGLVEGLGSASVVEAYLMLPAIHRHRALGNLEDAIELATETIASGQRFGDRDLVAFSRNMLGGLLIRAGDVEKGIALLDEAMLSAIGGDLSPMITGLVYCSVIETCCKIHAMDRAHEWTTALVKWCDSQPQLYTFIGRCMVHRAEISQLRGDWSDAEDEAREAYRHLADSVDRDSAAAAKYQEGEIQRLRGNYAEAEECYRQASGYGMEPQPGSALLRLAQGQKRQAAQTIRRVLDEQTDRFNRTRLLPAFVEIMLENGDVDEATRAADELADISDTFRTDVLAAIACQCRGQVLLARHEPSLALAELRRSLEVWQHLPAPYLACRIRVLIAECCRELDDPASAALELEHARKCFEDMGAVPDLSGLDDVDSGAAHGLTKRESEVLRLIVDGVTNKRIGQLLGLSPRTVDRHVGNILNKLGVSSRTEAATLAVREQLV